MDREAWWGYSRWGSTESDMTEATEHEHIHLFPVHFESIDLTAVWKMDSVQFSHSVVSDSLRQMNHSTPGHYQLPESTQTHVH